VRSHPVRTDHLTTPVLAALSTATHSHINSYLRTCYTQQVGTLEDPEVKYELLAPRQLI
jgi:hypothetical protein